MTMIDLNVVETAWITINLVTAILTIAALIEARRDWAALKRYNGSARGVVARSNIRSEWIRLAIQMAMLVIAIPSSMTVRVYAHVDPSLQRRALTTLDEAVRRR